MTTTSKPRRTVRPSRTFRQLWQVPTFLLGVAALSLVAANSRYRHDPELAELQRELAGLRQRVDDPHEKLKLPTPERLQSLVTKGERFPARAAEIYFVIGSIYWRCGEDAVSDQVRNYLAKSAEYLEKAKGIQKVDQPQLEYRLGMVLYQQGQNPGRAVELLAHALEQKAELPDRAYEMLIAAYQKQTPSEFEQALKVSDRQLEYCSQNEERTARALLTRADLLLHAERRHDAATVLGRIGSSAPKELRLKARYLEARCCETDGLWSRAIPMWNALLPSPNIVPGGKGHVLYSLGLCYRNNDAADAEIALDHWRKVLSMGGEEAQAAALRIGETRLTGDARAALKSWSDALAGIRKPGDFSNAYISLEQLRDMFEAGCHRLADVQDYRSLEQAAELYQRIADPGKAELLLAQAAETLARQLQEKAPTDAVPWFAKAAQAYEQVAQLAQLAPGQAPGEYVWLSATCYQSAGQFAQAARNLEKFVKVEKSEPKLAEAWLLLAQSYVELRLKDKALDSYHKCIDYHDTPFAGKARYQLALMEKDLKHSKEAIKILKESIRGTSPNIDRETHEKVVYLLSGLLFQEPMYDEAYIYLKEAIRQYPDNAAALATRDQLAECCRKLAELDGKRARDATGEEVKNLYRRKQRDWLQEAATNLQTMADELDKTDVALLSLEHRRLLRKALFNVAECYFEMNEIPECLRRYQILQNRYRKQGEGLIACHRIWLCRGKVVEPPEKVREIEQAVRAAVKIAQADLAEMPDGSPCFQGSSQQVLSRQQWIDWAGWVLEQLGK